MKSLGKTISGLWSLIVGLKVTGIELVKPQITIHYPRKEVSNLGTYRGHIELVPQAQDPQTALCIMCGKCEEICPSGCISLKYRMLGQEPPAAAGGRELALGLDIVLPGSATKGSPPARIDRVLESYTLNYNLCSLCGLCVQTCPVSSLRFSRDAYLAGTSRRDFEFDLLTRMRKGIHTGPQTQAGAEAA